MTDAPQKQPGAPHFEYVDLPDLPETFADSVHTIFFDGQTLRINFCASRLAESHPTAPQGGKKYPVCRLVLPPVAAVDLINKMQQISAALLKAGILKSEQGLSPQTGKTN